MTGFSLFGTFTIAMLEPDRPPPEPAKPSWLGWGITTAVVGGLLALILLADESPAAQQALSFIKNSLDAVYVIAAIGTAVAWLCAKVFGGPKRD